MMISKALIAALCLVVTALLTYLNHRLTRLPMAIGVMVAAGWRDSSQPQAA